MAAFDLDRHRQTRHSASHCCSGGHYTPILIGVVSTVLVFSFAALVSLWFRRPHSVLDVWLMVVMCAWMFDIALSAMLNVARFDLGFYPGRIYGLCAASFVLAVLLDRQCRPCRPNWPACSEQSAGRRPPKAISAPNANGFSARSWNPPTMPSSPRRSAAPSPRWNRRRRTPVRLHFDGGGRQADRYHRPAGPARRGPHHPRAGRPRRGDRAIRDPAHTQGRPQRRCVAEHLTDPVGRGRNHRRLQNRARHHGEQADAEGAQSGDRGTAAHLRDLAGPHPGDRYGRKFHPGQPERQDHPRLRSVRDDRAQRHRVHPPRRSRKHAR